MNPILVPASDGLPLVELKHGLVLYLRRPPDRGTVAELLAIYLRYAGARVKFFRSTAPGSATLDWSFSSTSTFFGELLPTLYRQMNWGWAFSDGEAQDSWLFMFHGYRPVQELGRASFVRFDFPWDVDPGLVRSIALEVADVCEFVSGFGGYYLQGRADLRWLGESYDEIFALAWRYMGAEAHNLDVTVDYIDSGFKCVNWLTLIGSPLIARSDAVRSAARSAASEAHFQRLGAVFQASTYPELGDRNRDQSLDAYRRLARALEPIQIQSHGSFGGNRWSDENVMDYLRRFTSMA